LKGAAAHFLKDHLPFGYGFSAKPDGNIPELMVGAVHLDL
jgi:hypothetical protein